MSKSEDEINLTQAISAAQLEKLHLEITQMKKGKWSDKIAPYINLFGVIIAVSGFIFGVVQFRAQQDLQLEERQKYRITQERETETKLQERFKTDLDKLLQFTKDEQITPGQVNLFLVDLGECIKMKSSYHKDSEPSKTETAGTREVTEMLAQSLLYDCELTQRRHVDFAEILLTNWPDLKTYFRENPDSGAILLNRYNYALGRLYAKDPETIRSITYDTEKENYDFSDVGKLEDWDENVFVQLIESYLDIYQSLEDIMSKEDKDEFIRYFQLATCNPGLTKARFGSNFEMTGNKTFKKCLK